MSKPLVQGCCSVEWWQDQNANPGPVGPKARALTTTPLSLSKCNEKRAENGEVQGLGKFVTGVSHQIQYD